MEPIQPLRAVVLISGRGTTLQNFIDKTNAGEISLKIERVISSKREAYGLERARKHDIDAITIPRKEFEIWDQFNQAISDAVEEVQPDIILLAGFLSLFRPDSKYDGKMMNSHPALIPAFCGKGMYGHHVHKAVIETGVKISGATIHYVDQHYDTGPIIIQEPTPVYFEDTPETLAERVQAIEREIYPKAIQLFAENRLNIHGRRVEVLPG